MDKADDFLAKYNLCLKFANMNIRKLEIGLDAADLVHDAMLELGHDAPLPKLKSRLNSLAIIESRRIKSLTRSGMNNDGVGNYRSVRCCNVCREEKDLVSNFPRYLDTRCGMEGYLMTCRKCIQDRRKIKYHTSQAARQAQIDSAKKWAKNNRDKVNKAAKRRFNKLKSKSPDKYQEILKANRDRNKLKYSADKEYAQAIRDKARERARVAKENLEDSYIKKILRGSGKPITEDAIIAKREKLKRKRYFKNLEENSSKWLKR